MAADTDTATEDDVLLRSADQRKMLGRVSSQTLWRLEKEDPDFPEAIVIRGRKYRYLSELKAYIESKRTRAA